MNKALLVAVSTLLICGCASTWLTAPDTQPKVLELAHTNTKPIILNLPEDQKNYTLGRQFLFVIIPFGIIKTESLNRLFSERIYTELTLNGYHPILDIGQSAKNVSYPSLAVYVDYTSIHAFDFIFMRRLKANVSLRFVLTMPNHTEQTSVSTKSASEIRPYGFKIHLEHLLKEVITEAIKENFNTLRLNAK